MTLLLYITVCLSLMLSKLMSVIGYNTNVNVINQEAHCWEAIFIFLFNSIKQRLEMTVNHQNFSHIQLCKNKNKKIAKAKS